MKKTEYPVPDPKDPNLTHKITGSEDAILALQELLNERRREGRSIGRAEAEEEITRLHAHLKAIAEHHEDQRAAWESVNDYDNARYHEERRDVAMFPLACPEARGETPLHLELAG